MSNDYYINMYIEYMNNFLTISVFAEYYGMPLQIAMKTINKGRLLHRDENN